MPPDGPSTRLRKGSLPGLKDVATTVNRSRSWARLPLAPHVPITNPEVA